MATADIIDRIGTDLPDRQEVAREARARALDALREGFAKGEDRRDWVMIVRNECGASLIRLTLGEAAGIGLADVLN